MARGLYFELHIRPMIRLIDRDHMLFKFDLFDAATVTTEAQNIVDHLAFDMPPSDSGGPWPEEWIATFRRWKDEGCKRLGIARGTFIARRHGNVIELRASGDLAKPNDTIWLERLPSSSDFREYVLYEEPSEGDPDSTPFEIRESIDGTGVTTIVVNDADGRHVVPIT